MQDKSASTRSIANSLGSPALWLLAVGMLSGCAAALPPDELVAARSAYTQAQNSAAADYAPAKLDGANQALQAAEASFEEEEGSDKTRALAYIAERRARATSSAGEKAAAERKRAELEKRYAELERKRLSMTQEELAAARASLEAERQRVAMGQMELAQKDKDLQAKDKDLLNKDKALEQKDAEIAAEREARKAAETKLSAAIASLKELGSIKEEARGVVITLSGSVLFATGKSELLPIAKDKLTEVATALKDQGYKQIIIEGHTDNRGSASANDKLSLDRATSVKNHLVAQGLDGSKIEPKGLGAVRPVASNDSPEGRANNRRVELVVTPK